MIYAIGEAVIDRVKDSQGQLKDYIGGAPLNVCGAVAKMKATPSFISKVGNDENGQKIINAIKQNEILTKYVTISNKYPTAIIDVNLDEKKERQFMARTIDSADGFLDLNDVESIIFNRDDILYFGSLALKNSNSRAAVVCCLEKIKKAKGFVCFDPNIRLNFWEDKQEYRQVVKKFIKQAHYLKMSLEDMEFIFPRLNETEVIKKILTGKTEIVLITKGASGAKLYTKEKVYESIYSKEYWDIVDTTGAGDIFVGAFLYYISYISKEDMQKALSFSTLAATLSCTKEGSFDSAPSLAFMDVFWEGAK